MIGLHMCLLLVYHNPSCDDTTTDFARRGFLNNCYMWESNPQRSDVTYTGTVQMHDLSRGNCYVYVWPYKVIELLIFVLYIYFLVNTDVYYT